MNKLIANNIIGFMSRAQLQGIEVPAYHEAMCALHEIASHKEVEPTTMGDGKKETDNGTDD